MAERTSIRTTSRRTTPQPAGQSARTTRITRSQSRDVSDSEEARIGIKARRGGKYALSDSAQNRAGQSIPKEERGRSINQSRALQDLSVVAEDSLIEYPDIEANRDDQEDGEKEKEHPIETGETNQQANTQSKSPGGISVFSGTTARTSRSAQELSDLSTEVMLDALIDLSRASDKMLNFLLPAEISEASITAHVAELQTKRSPANRNFIRLAATLSANRDMYSSEPYIALPEVLNTLIGVSNDDPGPWRPDALLHKANLAVLASSIFSRSWRTQDTQLVEELEQVFPMPFTEGFLASEITRAGYSELTDETFQLALDIRTQYAIILLARHEQHPNFDPDAVLLQVFYEDAKALRGWSARGLRAEDLTGEVQDTILSRLEKLREAFTNSGDDFATDVELLRSSFPWATLVMQAARWINLRLEELNRQISVHHGADQISKALEEEVKRMRLEKSSIHDKGANDSGSPRVVLEYDMPSELAETPAEPQSFQRKKAITKTLKLGQFSANSPKAVAAAGFVKRFEATRKASLTAGDLYKQQNQQSTSDIQVTATAGPSMRALGPQSTTDESVITSTSPAKMPNRREPQLQPNDDWRAQEEDDGPLLTEAHEALRQVSSQIYAKRAQQQAESNKENIEIPMSQPEPPPGSGRTRRLIDPQPSAQRLDFNDSEELNRNDQASQIEDPSSDGGFQNQHVAADIAQRRSLKPALKRFATQPDRPRRPSPKKARIREVDRSVRPRVARDPVNDEPSPSPIVEYRAANSSARERKAYQPKPPQTRKPWSDAETETLLTLIEKHGTSWALLLEEDLNGKMVLQSRGQVALKDKARNIKMDYLKSGTMLPRNFERVPISKTQMDILTGLGIQYDHETGRRVDAFVDIDDE